MTGSSSDIAAVPTTGDGPAIGAIAMCARSCWQSSSPCCSAGSSSITRCWPGCVRRCTPATAMNGVSARKRSGGSRGNQAARRPHKRHVDKLDGRVDGAFFDKMSAAEHSSSISSFELGQVRMITYATADEAQHALARQQRVQEAPGVLHQIRLDGQDHSRSERWARPGGGSLFAAWALDAAGGPRRPQVKGAAAFDAIGPRIIAVIVNGTAQALEVCLIPTCKASAQAEDHGLDICSGRGSTFVASSKFRFKEPERLSVPA
jgi:hypothetical protein